MVEIEIHHNLQVKVYDVGDHNLQVKMYGAVHLWPGTTIGEVMKALQTTFLRLLQGKRIEWICPCCGETIETDSDMLVNVKGYNLKIDCPACYAGMIANKILEDKQ